MSSCVCSPSLIKNGTITRFLVRAIAVHQFAGAAFILGFAALFGWQIGGFIRRNRPLAYTFESIPDRLLP